MMRNRIIAYIVCVSMLLSVAIHGIPNAYATEREVSIVHDGDTIEQLNITQNDKYTLNASCEGINAAAYQWQLLLDAQNAVWVDIYDKTESSCEVSYAVVKNLLDSANSTYIRCGIWDGTQWCYSEPVCVAVTFVEKEPPVVETEMILLTDMYVVEPETGNTKESETTVEADIEMEAMAAVLALEDPVSESQTTAKEYVTITIKYLDESSIESGVESAIYSPYVATIVRGSSFRQNVVSPTFLGFAPFFDHDGDGIVNGVDEENGLMLVLDYAAVDENIEIKVYYKPIEVNFAVRYFFQNINDDLYTEDVSRYHTDKAVTGTIIDDSYLKANAGETTGFTKMYHIPESVAADGSTVFECYYDRNYYLVQFDLNGGYGVEPIYARFGTPFVVNDPVRHGYRFAGWDLVTVDTDNDGAADRGNGIADELPTTILAQEQTYMALWETVNTTYTVVYWQENAEDGGYTYWGNAKKQAISSSYVSAEDSAQTDGMTGAQYFTFNSELSDKGVLVEGDGTTIVNAYYTRNYYKIEFKATGKCVIPERHTHTENCYDIICGQTEHVHDASCIKTLECELVEHKEHVEGCLVCQLEEHEHSETCCTIEPHAHTKACWGSSVGNRVNTPSGAPNNPGDGQIYQRRGNRYIYIGGSWYSYSGNENSGTIIAPSCGKVSHTHGEDCVYKDTAHTHNEECYKDKLHTHTDVCYRYSCNSSGHTHSTKCHRLKCGIPEGHTHNSTCTSDSRTNTVKIVYRKYQQSLEDLWPVVDDNGKKYDSGERWSPSDSSYYNQVLVYLSNMPPDDFTLTLSTSSAGTKTMNYYLQVLPGDAYDKAYEGKYYTLDNTIKAKYNFITKAEDFFDIKGFVQYASDPTFSGTQINANTADFYYVRITDHYLQFDNNGLLIKDKEVYGIMYGASVKDYYFVPDYPDNLEPNAYYFGGWYTSPGCYNGTEVNWDTITMPEGNLLLYAKWVPKTHKVNFFATYDDMTAYESGDTSVELHKSYSDVTHGMVVGSVEQPERSDDDHNIDLIFSGWFYMENGEKKAFSPLDMPINRDMNIFADWSSHSPQPYHITYVLLSNPDIKVADDTTGFAYSGSTRTFMAKAGNPYNQLYENYNEGYFPVVSSHSITMQYEEDKDHPVNNVYTFYYVEANDIEYTVRYVNKETNMVMDTITMTTGAAVVTERFKVYENMVPDAFYKRLVISVKWDEELGKYVGTDDNVITFYYTPNKTSAYYAVHYMLEKPNITDIERSQYKTDGSGGYEETQTHVEGVGDVGSVVEIIPQTFPGFERIDNEYVAIVKTPNASGGYVEKVVSYTNGNYDITITAEGTELYIFYKRLNYDYTVHYYLYNSTDYVDEKNFPDKIGSAPYESIVTETAPEVGGYTCVSETTQNIMIRDNSVQTTVNDIVFYYSPVQYVVEYEIVAEGEKNGIYLSHTIEVKAGDEDFEGSTPHSGDNYEFDGWYMDEDCRIPVTLEQGTVDENDGTFVPDKENLSETKRNIFYAKFRKKSGDLTITRTSCEDPAQVFVYEVKNVSTGKVINVTVVGNGSVTIHDLEYGQYSVTQQNDWSWRYKDAASSVNHKNDGTIVVFGGNADTKWLNGNSNSLHNTKTRRNAR